MPLQPTKAISILGDSISSLCGYTPADGAFYDPEYSRNTGISSVEDTWWMKVIHRLDGALLVNNSYAGSTVCLSGYQAASAPWRIAKLRKDGADPDMILIFTGLNDVAFYRPPAEFGAHYADMLHHMRKAYPKAEIWCGTLCRGALSNPNWPLFVNLDSCLPLLEYNEAIRAAVSACGCRLADLAAFDERYASIDGVHPNADGMELLAQLWLRAMRS